MNITENHLERIREELISEGVSSMVVLESLLDHICCQIESDTDHDFESAYARAKASFGESGFREVQFHTSQLINAKFYKMKNVMYICGYLAAILSTTGLLFKVQHWPGAMVMLTLGVFLFNFIFLPLYFIGRRKRALA